jgi:hypothetical protein
LRSPLTADADRRDDRLNKAASFTAKTVAINRKTRDITKHID